MKPNHIYLTHSINSKSADRLIFKLNRNAAATINLHISSPGGDIYSAFRLVDYIKGIQSQGRHIITIGEGLVASAATLLLISGTERLMTPNARFLMHQLRYADGMSETTHQNVNDNLYNLNRLNQMMIKHYLDHSDMSFQEIDKHLRNEKEFSIDECLSKGLIDKVYLPAI